MSKLKAVCVEAPKVALKAVVYGARRFNTPWLHDSKSLAHAIGNIISDCWPHFEYCERASQKAAAVGDFRRAARFGRIAEHIGEVGLKRIERNRLLFNKICAARSRLQTAVDQLKVEWHERPPLSEPLQS